MKLSLQTDYALRTLLLLAASPGRRVTMREISDFYDISLEHLRKVVNQLAALGYIDTFRGAGGGMVLRNAPETVTLDKIVESFEHRGRLVDCSAQPCRIVSQCRLKGMLAEAESAFYTAMARYSLKDMVDDPELIAVLSAAD